MPTVLEKLFSHVDASDGGSAPIYLLANPDSETQDDYVTQSKLQEVAYDAREVGRYLGEQELLDSDDQNVLLDIVQAISEIAMKEYDALVEESKSEDEMVTVTFFENALQASREYIMEPLLQGLQENDWYGNFTVFRDFCYEQVELWTQALTGDLEMKGKSIVQRMKTFYDNAFKNVEPNSVEG